MCHVLIIEDEPFVALAIQEMLEAEGAISFDFAATQSDAVEAALLRRPDLITSDVKLIEGTGPRAVAEIHARLGMVPVIFISATPSECEPCDPPGVILAKPVRRQSLQNAFHELL